MRTIYSFNLPSCQIAKNAINFFYTQTLLLKFIIHVLELTGTLAPTLRFPLNASRNPSSCPLSPACAHAPKLRKICLLLPPST